MGGAQAAEVAAEEVEKSMEWVGQLRELCGRRGMEGVEIADKVVNSLSVALAALRGDASGEVEEGEADHACAVGSPCSGSGRRSSGGPGRAKGKTGGFSGKRAGRRSHPYMCHKISSASLVDGYTWRKYGQKTIQSSKYPRSYYRCTYKYSRGCNAVRQAQQMEDDPSTYTVTYLGHHTCQVKPSTSTSSDHNSTLTEEEEKAETYPPPPSDDGGTVAVMPKEEATDGGNQTDDDTICWREMELPLLESRRSLAVWEEMDVDGFFCKDPSEMFLCCD